MGARQELNYFSGELISRIFPNAKGSNYKTEKVVRMQKKGVTKLEFAALTRKKDVSKLNLPSRLPKLFQIVEIARFF